MATEPRGHPTWHPHSPENDSFILYVEPLKKKRKHKQTRCLSFSLQREESARKQKGKRKSECLCC